MTPKEFGPTFNGIALPETVFLPPEVLQAMPYMTGAELKVTIAALSRTAVLGGGEPITLDDFEAITGLSRPAVHKGLKRALARGILTRYPLRRPTGHLTYVYDLAVAPTTPQLKKLTADRPVKELSSRVVVDTSSGDQQQLLSPPQKAPKKLPHPSHEAVLALRRLGVYPRIAAQLAAQVPPERLQTAIRLYRLALQAGLAENPGWLVTLLRDAQRDPAAELAALQERVKGRLSPAPADSPSSLPSEVQAQLQALNWVGSLDEVEAAWNEDAERVRNLLWYAQQHRLKAGWLRHALRQGFWPPEDGLLPETRERRRQAAHRRSWAVYAASLEDEADGEDASLPPSLETAWQAMLPQAQQLPEASVWLAGLTPWRLEEDTLWLHAINPGVAAWFQRHAQALTDLLNAHLHQPIHLALGAPK